MSKPRHAHSSALGVGRKVRVYRNLHTGTYSVQERQRSSWIVVAHCDRATLRDAEFRVSEAGRQRVLRERRKNVHAYVYGITARAPSWFDMLKYTDNVAYNPYRGASFHVCGRPVLVAKAIHLDKYGARALCAQEEREW